MLCTSNSINTHTHTCGNEWGIAYLCIDLCLWCMSFRCHGVGHFIAVGSSLLPWCRSVCCHGVGHSCHGVCHFLNGCASMPHPCTMVLDSLTTQVRSIECPGWKLSLPIGQPVSEECLWLFCQCSSLVCGMV